MSKLFTNPFPGLRPFQKNESSLFFGRENHIREILRKLENYRFVSIVGNSGSGKSSLVRAGILPQLENTEDASWLICIMRPGKNPIDELSDAISSQITKNNDSDSDVLRKNKLGLVQVLRNNIPEGKRLLILVDQFEELFRFRNLQQEKETIESANHFVDLLLGAVGQKEVPIYVIMTIRSDFLGDCEQFMGLPEAINDGQFLIPRMNRDELQRSITGPIDLVEGKISPQLVHQLLNEVGNSPDQLPVLQHVLMRSWEVWEKAQNTAKPIDIETYEKTGGMSKALSNHAEEAYAELNTERKQKLAELIFKTITLKGSDNRGIRRPTVLSNLVEITQGSAEEIIDVVNIFRRSDRGFLMPPDTIPLTKDSVLDISHESLMRVWDRLGNWVDEEAESAEIFQRICESALLYDKNMAGLWRDPDLQIAIDWKKSQEPNAFWGRQYNTNFDLAIRFIDASIQDKKFFLAEKQRLRKWTRITVIGFLIVLSCLTLWAYIERNRSGENERLALTEKEKAEKQEAIAKEQKKVAELNAIQAEREKANAENEKLNADKQKRIAVQNATEAEIQKLLAVKASLAANEARQSAELDKQIAQLQKQLSDSMKTVANLSEKNAYRLRILSIAQTLAIKSSQADKGTYDDGVKPLLALQAYRFNNAFNGKAIDPDIFNALFSSVRFMQNKADYIQNHHSDAVRSVTYSPDGKYIATAGNDGKLLITTSNNLQTIVSGYAPQLFILETIAYNKDGSKICASADKSLFVYDLANSKSKPKQINTGATDKISSFVWFNNHLISASLDQSIKQIDPDNSKILNSVVLDAKPSAMAVDESRKILYIGCENGKLYLIHTDHFNAPKLLKQVSNARITCIDLSSDGQKLACGTSEGIILILNVNAPDKNEISITAHKAIITNVKFTPSSNFLASSSYDASLKLWNMTNTDEQPIVFKEHDSWVYALAISPDGNTLVSGGRDKSVRLFPMNQEKMASSLKEKVTRNLTQAEWTKFIGADIPYEKTLGH